MNRNIRSRFTSLTGIVFLVGVLLWTADSSQLAVSNVNSSVGDTVVLPCNATTPCLWSRVGNDFTLNDISVGGTVNAGLPDRDRFNASSPVHGLSITGSRIADSGLYVCVENNGTGIAHFVRLVVSVPTVTTTPGNFTDDFNATLVTAVTPVNTKYYWLIALAIFIGTCVPLLIVCAVFGIRGLAEKKKKPDTERTEKLLQ